MLAITRRQGDTIRIGPDIVITIIQTTPSKCRIGIDAPNHVEIERGELPERIDRRRKVEGEA